ncbi:MAG: SpoIID/LytB domain-containing protein [Synechococcaceae cyanobacterium]|nr:SpoIID/LytB domain-containing protein [Synechococcaceae cyanobacterium]
MPPFTRRGRVSRLILPIAGLTLLVLERPLARALPAAESGPPAATIRTPAPIGRQGPQLRVLLQQAESLELAAASAPLRLRSGGGAPLLLEPGRPLAISLTADGGLSASVQEPGGPHRAQLSLAGDGLWLEPLASGSDGPQFLLRDRLFRGRLQVRLVEGRLQAINHIGLESYLASVVGSEMPASWPLAALEAQAVAARTYALAQRRPNAPFDLRATVASQMYRGVIAETASTRRAVERTRGEVLTHGTRLIQAVFHSSSGGSTENSGEIWRQQHPYLVSVPDFDAASPVARWEQRFSPGQLRLAFKEIDGVRSIEVLASSSTGRIRQARVLGPGGSLLLSGAELRQRLGLRSTWVSFSLEPAPPSAAAAQATGALSGGGGALSQAVSSALQISPAAAAQEVQPEPEPSLLAIGRGFGHGVGMSQWGAFAMAQSGRDYRSILEHYYRGASLSVWRGP